MGDMFYIKKNDVCMYIKQFINKIIYDSELNAKVSIGLPYHIILIDIH